MTSEAHVARRDAIASADREAKIVALAGVGLIGYGILFLIRNFTGFAELRLSAEQAGGTPKQIEGFSPNLYHYISHQQLALSGFIIALGVAVITLALFGIRRGHCWALVPAFLAPVTALAIALPLHYPWGFATLGNLGLMYLDAVILLAGTVLSFRGMRD